MKRLAYLFRIACFVVLALMLSQCAKAPATPLEEATVAPSPTFPVAVEPSPTQPPPPMEEPTEVPSPTQPPLTSTPTNTPEPMAGWSSFATDRVGLSFSHPGEWFGPAELPQDEGYYVKNPDLDIGVILRVWETGEPDQRLAAWGTNEILVEGILQFTPLGLSDGAPVVISRLDVATKIAQGESLTAQVAFVKRPQGVLEVIRYATNDQWEAMQVTFADLLSSIEIWIKYPNRQYGLQTMYLHDWSKPEPPWEGNGLWFHSTDKQTGVVVWIRDFGDPIKLLTGWKPDGLIGLSLSQCTPASPSEQINALSGQWDARNGECKDSSGTSVRYQVAFVQNRDRVLEIVAYAPAAQWETVQQFFETTLSMLIDIR